MCVRIVGKDLIMTLMTTMYLYINKYMLYHLYFRLTFPPPPLFPNQHSCDPRHHHHHLSLSHSLYECMYVCMYVYLRIKLPVVISNVPKSLDFIISRFLSVVKIPSGKRSNNPNNHPLISQDTDQREVIFNNPDHSYDNPDNPRSLLSKRPSVKPLPLNVAGPLGPLNGLKGPESLMLRKRLFETCWMSARDAAGSELRVY